MVKTRQIPELQFCGSPDVAPGFEVLTLAELRSRADPAHFREIRRTSFHTILTLDSGALPLTVDFADHVLTPSDTAWIRAGQVQRWGDITGLDGLVLLFEDGFLPPAAHSLARSTDPHMPVVRALPEPHLSHLRDTASQLLDQYALTAGFAPEVRVRILTDAVSAYLLHLTAVSAPADLPRPCDVFLAFDAAVERDFARTRRLEDYAKSLSYSARTLSRATTSMTGLSAKEFIDRRVALEARRLLAHSDQTAAAIASRLGFSSPTNFSKFFAKHTGKTPLAFRTAQAG
ncbi:helix-turn-helix domain-containing protein [Salininema proteolyticum]|uniref:Helix-turn-helix domain-containing protein n=1 Tax=Salininema proteolyticum TaxID=1607685 RepID=A0ABV8U026_9ACTN